MKRMKKLLAFALVLLIGGGIFLSAFPFKASAESVTYSDVLEDLQKDPKFDATKYPAKADDTSVSLIQIAESEDNELFLYVYQPSDAKIDLECTAVSIHIGYSVDGSGLDPELYDLKLVSENGVFDKYLVNGFTLPKEAYRYYNVVALYREYNSVVDGAPGTGMEVNEKAFSVGQQWCAYTLNDRRVYEMNTFNTIQLDCAFTGSLQLKPGITLGGLVGSFEYNDLWFYTFDSEDYIIEKVFKAKMSYKERGKAVTSGVAEPAYDPWSDVLFAELDKDDLIDHQGAGLFAKKYSFNEILSTEDFIQQCNDQDVSLPQECLDGLEKGKFVFCFAVTEKRYISGSGIFTIITKDVGYVSPLQISFQDINGNIYDLGVVADRVDPDDIPDGFGNGIDTEAMEEWFETFLLILLLILIVVIINPIVSVIKFIVSCITFILQIIFWIISFPFRFLKYRK